MCTGALESVLGYVCDTCLRSTYLESRSHPLFLYLTLSLCSYKDRFPNKSACCILTEAQASWFGEWKDQKCMKRDDQYQAKKKAFEKVLLRGMYKNYPKTEGKVQFVDMSTPLTNMHYLASPDGCSYGFQGSAKRFNCDALKPRSPIPGLWMSGQDVTSFGIAGAIMGGVLCCHDILGYDAADLILYDRDLIHDMMNLPECGIDSK